MKIFNLEDLQLVSTQEIYVVRYNGEIITLDGKTTFSKFVYAKNRLQHVFKDNYHQGHYWHKGKDNTFAKEGGHMRNGGVMSDNLDKIFKNLSEELTEEVLKSGLFKIEKIK